MKTFLIPLALVASLTASTATMAIAATELPSANAQADVAGLHANGRSFNGISLNGVRLNGISLNGISLNGMKVNGIHLNDIKWNGVQFNGWSLNGSSLYGQRFVSVFDDSDNSMTDTNWSSIALNDVRVRLPLAR